VLAVVKANAYGHGLMRVLPALATRDGSRLIELDAAIALRPSDTSRAHPAARGLLRADELPEIAQRRLALSSTATSQLRMLERRARAPHRGVRQDQLRDEPPRHRAGDVSRVVERLNTCDRSPCCG
jgi:alanine racemase